VPAVKIAGVSRDYMVVDVPQSAVNAMQEKDPNTLTVKVDFVAFIAQVRNCTSHTNKTSKELDIVKATNRFLDLQDFTA
jgi:hypothetical protein